MLTRPALLLLLLCGLAAAAFNPSCTAQDIDVLGITLSSTNDFCALKAKCAAPTPPSTLINVTGDVFITNDNNANRYCISLWPCFGGGTPGNAIALTPQISGRDANHDFAGYLTLTCDEFNTLLAQPRDSLGRVCTGTCEASVCVCVWCVRTCAQK